MSKRLAYLEKATAAGSTDPFLWYGLALEYRSLERNDEALATFTKIRADHADYLPAFLMAGQLLEKMGRIDDAKEWLNAGIAVAKKKGDSHAQSELESALSAL